MKKLIRRCASMGAVFLLTGCIITAAAAGLGGSLPGYRFHPLRGLFLLEERTDDFFDSLEDRLDQIFDRDIWEHHRENKEYRREHMRSAHWL